MCRFPIMAKLLDVALIVKDEAHHLPVALESMTAFASVTGRICVYDTGSTDGTQEIARSFGAVVKQGHWDNDFSRARNEAIGMCAAPWVLIVDADEVLHGDPAALQRVLRKTSQNVDGLNVRQTNIRDDGVGIGDAWSTRILRRTRMRYLGAVHERPARRGGEPGTLKDISSDVFRMSHSGYTSASLPEKLRRNLPIINEEIDRHRASGRKDLLARAHIDRARTLVGMGEVAAARSDFDRVMELGVSGKQVTWAMEQYAEVLIESGDIDAAQPILSILEDPSTGADPQLVSFLKAQAAYNAGDPVEALRLVRQVDTVTAAVALTRNNQPAIQLRMLAALGAGVHDEALACCLQLMVTYRVANPFGNILMTLWSGRPLDALVEILSEAPADFIPVLVAELAASKHDGPAAASLLAQRHGLAVPAPRAEAARIQLGHISF